MAINNCNAIIVVRVSGAEQMKGTSLESQEQMARTVAQRLNASVIEVYNEGAVSGSLYMSRDGLQEALCRIERGEAKYLIFGQFDRSARDSMNVETIFRRVAEAGGEIHCADMSFENSDEGILVRQQMASFKEYERRVIATRTKRGRRTRAKQGLMPMRHLAPYGYYIPRKADADTGEYSNMQVGHYVVIENEAEIVREIFEMFVTGAKPYNAIANEMTSRGLKSPQGANSWTAETIKHILKNSAYRGRAVFGKTKRVMDEARKVERGLKRPYYNAPTEKTEQIDIPCHAILSDDLWLAAQERMQAISEKHVDVKGHRNHSNSLLAGILRCPECGAGMNRFNKSNPSGKTYHYYRCPYGAGMRKRVTTRTCHMHRVSPVAPIEEHVLKIVVSLARNPNRIDEAVAAYGQAFFSVGANNAKRKNLNNELDELTKRELAVAKKQIEAEVTGRSTAVYDEMLNEINARRNVLFHQIEELPQEEDTIAVTADHQQQFATQLKIVTDVLASEKVPLNEKRDILDTIIERVNLLPDHTVEVRFRQFSVVGSGISHIKHNLL